jgi:hypothetical protein
MSARDIGDDGVGRETLGGDPRFLRVGTLPTPSRTANNVSLNSPDLVS